MVAWARCLETFRPFAIGGSAGDVGARRRNPIGGPLLCLFNSCTLVPVHARVNDSDLNQTVDA